MREKCLQVEPDAAGIDVGATEVYAAPAADRDPQPVRCFKTLTAFLRRVDEGTLSRLIQFRRLNIAPSMQQAWRSS